MKKWLLMLVTLLLIASGTANALTLTTGFSTAPLPEGDIETILENTNISMLHSEPQKKPIECFSVNENGLIAIGCSDGEKKTVCIYTDSGKFQYGYAFKTSGAFGVELNENMLYIYFVRSDIAIAVNPIGEVISIAEILNTSENNSYWFDSVFSVRRKIGSTEYALKNDVGFLNIFASTYSQLTVSDENGEVHIIYDVNSYQSLKLIIAFAVVVLVTLVAIVVIAKQFRKLKHPLHNLAPIIQVFPFNMVNIFG